MYRYMCLHIPDTANTTYEVVRVCERTRTYVCLEFRLYYIEVIAIVRGAEVHYGSY